MDKTKELKEAYDFASPGVWTSKSTAFTALDRDFANLAHNMTPVLLEAVRELEAIRNLAYREYDTNDAEYNALRDCGNRADYVLSELGNFQEGEGQ